MAFDHSRRRWFGTCSCKPIPRGLPSSVEQQGCFELSVYMTYSSPRRRGAPSSAKRLGKILRRVEEYGVDDGGSLCDTLRREPTWHWPSPLNLLPLICDPGLAL